MKTTIRFSARESELLGLDIVEFISEKIDDELLERIEEIMPEMAIVTVPASENDFVHRLTNLGIYPNLANTLNHYRCNFSGNPVNPPEITDFVFRISGKEGRNKLGKLAGTVRYGLTIFDTKIFTPQTFFSRKT